MPAFGNVEADRENLSFLIEQKLEIHFVDDALARLRYFGQTRTERSRSVGRTCPSALALPASGDSLHSTVQRGDLSDDTVTAIHTPLSTR